MGMQHGDEAEDFRVFVLARAPQLRRSAHLLVGGDAEADELVQATLVKIYLAWDKVSRADDPVAYAKKILYTTASRQRRRLGLSRSVGPEPASNHSHGQLDDRDDLRRALLTLPKRQRAIVVLRFYEDLSVAQTAALMGCSAGTVKSQTSKALAKLRVSPLLAPEAPTNEVHR
ncbi:MAG TPA: SigE family RNA polymerase sigma factor [Frankiaceae bacterium]|jgi:RNA polymerase sigma-70 factor (sigma-E family)|nr:SigE family RNA polymerase sigma factor [Frankiaceae bacterium]